MLSWDASADVNIAMKQAAICAQMVLLEKSFP